MKSSEEIIEEGKKQAFKLLESGKPLSFKDVFEEMEYNVLDIRSWAEYYDRYHSDYEDAMEFFVKVLVFAANGGEIKNCDKE